MQKKTIVGVAALLIAGLVAAWIYYSPHLAVHNMRKAAESRDFEKLSGYINFPSLRESLKASMGAMLMENVAKSTQNNPFEAFGAAMATAFLGPMIDAMVTPESLARMMQGAKPELGQRSHARGDGAPGSEAAAAKRPDTSMGYESYDRFVVHVRPKGDTEDAAAFVYQRDGLVTWKLTSLRMPRLQPKAAPDQIAAKPKLKPDASDLTKYVGQVSTEIFNDTTVQQKFAQLLGPAYGGFLTSLSVVVPLKEEGDFYLGSGCAAHQCGTNEAAFAINTVTGAVFASMLLQGTQIQLFGVDAAANLPAPLYVWYKEHGGS